LKTEILENVEIMFFIFEILKFFRKNSEFSLIDDEVRVFRIHINLLSNPVAELKIRENDSIVKHWKRRKIAILM
jgi:hypothetical protein